MPPLVMIFVWPFVSAVLFSKYTIPLAVLLTIFGGYMLLPHGINFDLPLVPALNKHSVPALSALALSIILFSKETSRESLPGIIPKTGLLQILLVGLLVAAFMMVLTNSDVVRYGPLVLPAMRPYDGFSLVLSTIVMVVPLLLGRKFLASPQHHRLLLYVFLCAGLAYSLLALFEVRMSPQLNNWIYGYFPHSWAQHVRSGGFRPIIFLEHGLFVGLFFAMSAIAAIGVLRLDKARFGLIALAVVWLFLTLVLVKSLGALLIALLIAPVALFFVPRVQIVFAAAICAIFLAYPVVRTAGIFPVDGIEKTVAAIDASRALSLRTRFDYEELLLAKASERPAFGWGDWGRWRIYDERTGADQTLSDGYWVITISEGGWARYISEFGLLTLPIFLLLWRRRSETIGLETSVLCLLLAGNVIDLIPNSGITPLTWLISGALWGRIERGSVVAQIADQPHVQAVRKTSTYTQIRGGSASEAAPAPEVETDTTEETGSRYKRSYKAIQRQSSTQSRSNKK